MELSKKNVLSSGDIFKKKKKNPEKKIPNQINKKAGKASC